MVEQIVIEQIKKKLDASFEHGNINKIQEAITESLQLLNKDLSQEQKVSLCYSIGTAFGDLDFLGRQHHPDRNYTTYETELEKSVFYFRMAIDESSKTKKLELGLLEQLFTNTGNQYDVIGRPITSILYYNYALKEKPHFPMALGNKGIALMTYADFLYDLGHKNILDHMAFQLLDAALQRKEYLEKHGPACIKCFQQYKNQLEQTYSQQFLSSKLDLDGYTYGDSTDEIEYKFWVAQNTLFLNPLNDITDMTIAAEDIIHLPTMMYYKNNNNFAFHYGLFNQIKEEYVCARFQLYKGIQKQENTSIADKDVLIINVDHNVTSYSDYSIRNAFKTGYSLFDRIAYFINDYFNLGIEPYKISFRNIWRTDKSKKLLRNKISENFMLYGIYWLSKDIYQENYQTIKPRSKKLDKLRNRIEHRYIATTLLDYSSYETDERTAYINIDELYENTLDILHLCRELIIYLSLAIHIEERKKSIEAKENGELIGDLTTYVLPDDLK